MKTNRYPNNMCHAIAITIASAKGPPKATIQYSIDGTVKEYVYEWVKRFVISHPAVIITVQIQKFSNRARCISKVLAAKSPYPTTALKMRNSGPNPSAYVASPRYFAKMISQRSPG